MQRKGLADQVIRSKMFPSRLSNGLLLVCLGKFYLITSKTLDTDYMQWPIPSPSEKKPRDISYDYQRSMHSYK